MKKWAYDIETIINCFTVTFVNTEDFSEYKQFVICELRNDIADLLEFSTLFSTDTFVTFNGENFDKPILFELLGKAARIGSTPSALYLGAYYQAQQIVSGESKPNPTSEGTPQIDLFKLYHFDNEARRTSLKWIQCHLGMDNIQDMPHHHDKPVTSIEQVDMILKYNLNDCIATALLFNNDKTQQLIAVRDWAFEKYDLRSSKNISNAHMGELIFLSTLGNIPPPDKGERKIAIADLILPFIKFKTKEFKDVLNSFKRIKLSTTMSNDKIKIQAIKNGMKYVFGLGGIHAAREESIHEDVDSIDVKSFYPNIAIQFGFTPKHVGQKFTETYKKLYEQRIATSNPVANNALKESLNSVFGKSNSEFSPLYDPAFTFSITANGQLLMAMLAEAIEFHNAGQVIMANTDGMEVKVYNREIYERILSKWIELTGMSISKSSYSKLVIRDVNNYIGIMPNGKIKTKGAYETSKDWNKDPSARILAMAAIQFHAQGIPVSQTILNSTNLDDFFLFKRAKTGKFIGMPSHGSMEYELPKTIRYLVTKSGLILYQKTDSMNAKVHSDAYVTVVNARSDEKHDLDYSWYIREAEKLIVKQNIDLFSL